MESRRQNARTQGARISPVDLALSTLSSNVQYQNLSQKWSREGGEVDVGDTLLPQVYRDGGLCVQRQRYTTESSPTPSSKVDGET